MQVGRETLRTGLALALAAAALAAMLFASTADAANGRWDRLWGKNVSASTPGSGPEICTVASDCQTGFEGVRGGEFDNPTRVAADDQFVYVSEQSRVEKFRFDGSFVLAWGRDVVAGNAETGFEVCRAADGDICKAGVASGEGAIGPFTAVATRTDILFTEDVFVSDTDRIQRFSENGDLELIMGNNVIATGSPNDTADDEYEVCDPDVDTCQPASPVGSGVGNGEFALSIHGIAAAAGKLYTVDLERIARYSALTGAFERTWGKDVIESNAETGFEVCLPSDDCGSGDPGSAAGELSAPGQLAVGPDQSVFVSEHNNRRISKFTSDGGFIRAWGRDVTASGGGDTAADGAEICHPTGVTLDVCQAGEDGLLAGEFSVALLAIGGLATDADRNVYVSANERVQKFEETGVFERAWGGDVVASGPSNTLTNGFEICLAADVCKAGAAAGGGGGGGRFWGVTGLATNPARDLFVVDGTGSRVQKFSDTIPPGTPAAPGSTPPGPTAAPLSGPTGQQAAALAKCKKIKNKKKKKKCIKKAK